MNKKSLKENYNETPCIKEIINANVEKGEDNVTKQPEMNIEINQVIPTEDVIEPINDLERDDTFTEPETITDVEDIDENEEIAKRALQTIDDIKKFI